MKAPGPISEVKKILKFCHYYRHVESFNLMCKWKPFALYIGKKYNMCFQPTTIVNWPIWGAWYLIHCKKEKCKEILK